MTDTNFFCHQLTINMLDYNNKKDEKDANLSTSKNCLAYMPEVDP